MKRWIAMAAVVGPVAFGCQKHGTSAIDGDAAASSARRASRTLEGTWRPTAMVATYPGTEASVQALNAQLTRPEAQATRVVYTGTRVQQRTPGMALTSNAYTVVEDSTSRCVLEIVGERVTAVFADDDHVTIERRASPFGAKMKMERARDDAGP